jgi:hypothetical protein
MNGALSTPASTVSRLPEASLSRISIAFGPLASTASTTLKTDFGAGHGAPALSDATTSAEVNGLPCGT